MRAGATSATASMMRANIGRPPISCSDFGNAERMRAPAPPARIIASTVMDSVSVGAPRAW